MRTASRSDVECTRKVQVVKDHKTRAAATKLCAQLFGAQFVGQIAKHCSRSQTIE
jgi:hypothetical protein